MDGFALDDLDNLDNIDNLDAGFSNLDTGSTNTILCDFDEDEEDETTNTNSSHKAYQSKIVKSDSYKNSHGQDITYDDRTEVWYKTIRKTRIDPISNLEVDKKYAFKFKYRWDPYTGERLGEDPYGAIYFDPVQLVKYFYTNRTRRLWVAPTDDGNGYYEGYYDDGVGATDQFYVRGRGHHPEWYIFRLPLPDCYLTKDHNEQVPTMGPKLTDEEIIDIDNKVQAMKTRYKNFFGKNPPSLPAMKKQYDKAIAQKPSLEDTDIDTTGLTEEQLMEQYGIQNREAVNRLVEMSG